MTLIGNSTRLLIVVDHPAEATPPGTSPEVSPGLPPELVDAIGHDDAALVRDVRVAPLADVLRSPQELEQAGLVWLHLGAATGLSDSTAYEVLGQIEEHQLPALLTHPDQPHRAGDAVGEGIIACPSGTPTELARALLSTVFTMAGTLAAARGEVRMMRAHQGGLADQIGKIDEELRLAAQLQKEFLPREMPRLGEVSFHALWRPAGYVSGDIYDVFQLDEHHVGFFIADAVGHGVPAALMTMYIKRSLTPKIIDPAAPRGYRLASPAQALCQLNHSMCEQQTGNIRFATAAYALLDTRSLQLCVARAGHPYPMLLRGKDSVQTMEPEGGLLGVFPEEEFEQVCVQMEPGDRLLLYSDGFEVAFPEAGDGKSLANEQYTQEFQDMRHGSPDQALGRLRDKLDTQAGSLNQRDDLTVVCMAVDPEAQVQTVDQANPAFRSTAIVTA